MVALKGRVAVFLLGVAFPVSLAGQAGTASSAAEGAVPNARAVRAQTPILLDGRMDEDAWQHAPAIEGFRQIEPVQGADPLLKTRARILFDDEALYVGFEVSDPDGPVGIRAPEMRRNFGYDDNDLVGVALDGFGDGRSAMAFQVNPHGAIRDLRVLDGFHFDEEWRGVWDARTRIHDGGWTAEIRIPWSTLRYDPGAGAWRLTLVRRTRRLNEEAGWPEWPRQNNAYSMRFAGRLEGLAPPPPARNLELQPYVTLRSEGDPTSGRAFGERRRATAGGDLKWAVTPSTVVDVTVNTDFAEADADRQVLDLTRFSVFFPEQRPFFLENAGLFRAGGGSYLEPFFTRRIGLDASGRPIPLDGGVRVTQQSPTRSAGALVLRQREADGSPTTHFAVGRAQQNIGAQHRVGILAASRLEEGGVHNHVGALDFFVRPRATTYVRGMVSGSHTDGPDARTGWSAFAHVSNNFSWGYVGWIQVLISPDYHASTGFVPRPDLVTTSPAMNLDLRPAWLPTGVRSYRPGFTTSLHHRLSDGRFQEGRTTFRPLNVIFQDGSEASLWARADWQRLDRDFRPIPGLEIPPGDYDVLSVGFTRRPDLSRPYFTYVTVAAGGFYDGRTERLVYRASPLPGPRLGLTFDYSGNRFRRVGGDPTQRLTTHLVGVQLQAALDPRLQLSTLVQRNSSTRRGTLNARLSWEFAPLSFLHLVVNDGRPVGSELAPGAAPPAAAERQILLKGSYVWQP